jgi:hypothetical protein
MAKYTMKKVQGKSVNAPNKEVYAILRDGKNITKTGADGTVYFKWATRPESAQAIIDKLKKADAGAASGSGSKKKASPKAKASSKKASTPKASTSKSRMSLADCRKLLESKGYEVTKVAEEEIEYEDVDMGWVELSERNNPRRRRRRR